MICRWEVRTDYPNGNYTIDGPFLLRSTARMVARLGSSVVRGWGITPRVMVVNRRTGRESKP